MTVLVTGGSGLCGYAIATLAMRRGRHVVAVANKKNSLAPTASGISIESLDVTRPECAKVVAALAPAAIVHGAALTNVDLCEAHPAEAYRANVWGTARLAEVASSLGVPFVFLSTHHVFDGIKGGETEVSAPAPCNVYASTKAAAEEVTLAFGGSVIRIMPVGVHPRRRSAATFGEWLVASILNDRDMQLFTDAIISPTTPERVADFVLHLLDARARPGISHLASHDATSKADFAAMVIRTVPEYRGKVQRVLSTRSLSPRRPANGWVDAGMTAARMAYPMPSWSEVAEALTTHIRAERAGG